MSWWNRVLRSISLGDLLYTPGRGLLGARRSQFTIGSKDIFKIVITSGNGDIVLEKLCFDTIESAFTQNTSLWLRVASLHDNNPFPNSADRLIRDATGSNLARGNYVCSLLENCGLVRYTMQGNQKGIKLP